MSVNDAEVEVVAQELAKAGGVSWHPGRTTGAVLRVVSDRYRDRARLAIAALERWRSRQFGSVPAVTSSAGSSSPPALTTDRTSGLLVGATVIYRPPGDKRAIACRVEKAEEGRVYLVPYPVPDVGWVDIETLRPVRSGSASDEP
jgi:hypothetical protein